MSDMMERVANAIKSNLRDAGYNQCAALFSTSLAKVAIAAMEKPTDDMIACAESEFPLFAEEYSRAIRAALKE